MKRNNTIEFMRVIASLLVICIHVNPLRGLTPSGSMLLHQVIARIAVPFFFVTTGYFLANRLLVHNDVNKKKIYSYLAKIVKVFLVWTTIYFVIVNIVSLSQTNTFFYEGNIIVVALKYIRSFIVVGYYHLWYLNALIISVLGIYIMSSKLSFKAMISISALLYFIGLFGESYFGILPASLQQLVTTYQLIFTSTRNGLFMGIPFLLLGCYIRNNPFKLSLKHTFIGFLGSLFIMILEVVILTTLKIPQDYNMTISLPLVSLFVFNLLLQLDTKVKVGPSLTRLIPYLNSFSLYVYLTHFMYVLLFRDILRFEQDWLIFILVVMSSAITSAIIVSYQKHGNQMVKYDKLSVKKSAV